MEKLLKCCNCLDSNNLERHHITPYRFVRYFPVKIRSLSYYNTIVKMCSRCHRQYEVILECEIDQIYKEYCPNYKKCLDIYSLNKDKRYYINMPKIIVKDKLKNSNLESFIQFFKNHFLDTMNPRITQKELFKTPSILLNNNKIIRHLEKLA